MKIKILAKKLSLSGIDKSLCSIVNMLSVNHEVTLVQTYKEENGTHKLNDNVKQVFLLSSEKEEKRSIVKKLLLKIKVGFLNKSVIKKEIKKNDYDVLITSNSIYVKWFKYNKMNKYKVFIENNYHLDNKKEIKKVRKNYKYANYILTVSKEIRDYYKKYLKMPCYHMPNVLDDIPTINSDFSKKNIITVGRLTSDKGVLDIINMYYQVQLELPDVTLDIVGDGPELNKIKKKIFDLRIKDKVTLHGYQNKDYINDLLSHSSVFVLASKKESFGLSLLEAMSYGLPSVVFDTATGVLEFMEDNSNGYIVKNRDIEEMARKVKLLLSSDEFKILIGNKAKETAKMYSYSSLTNRWNDFIDAIINGKEFDKKVKIEDIKEDIYAKNDIQSLLQQIADKDNQKPDTSNLIE